MHNTEGSSGIEMRTCDGRSLHPWEFSNTGALGYMINADEGLIAERRNNNLSPCENADLYISRREQLWNFVAAASANVGDTSLLTHARSCFLVGVGSHILAWGLLRRWMARIPWPLSDRLFAWTQHCLAGDVEICRVREPWTMLE